MIIVHPQRIADLNWQLLINELRLKGHKVTVTDEQYCGDPDTGTPTLLVSDSAAAIAESPLPGYLIKDHPIGTMAIEIDELENTEIITDLPFGIDAAIQLYKEKPVQLIREALGTSSKVLVFKGHDCVLIMKDSGNEYTALPSAMKRLASLGAASKVIIASGFETTDSGLRLKVCKTCPYLSVDTCLVCGCYVLAKAAFRSSECPKGYWP